MSEIYNKTLKETFANRASTYDESSGSYHVDLARDFVQFVNPQPRDRVLDVACGTGLVAIDVAGRVGAAGKVIAVDWSPEMQEVGKAKISSQSDSSKTNGIADIEWVVADITSEQLLEQSSVKEVVTKYGGFDIITMLQGYMYLLDLQGTLRFWAEKLLKKGGRIVSDMTTEDPSLQYLMTYHLPMALNASAGLSSGRVYITDQQSFENLFRNAGLDIVQTVRSKLYGPEYWFAADEKTGLEVLQKEIERNLPWTPEKDKLQEAKEIWPRIWKNAATTRSNGSQGIEGRHPFYFCVGRKPL